MNTTSYAQNHSRLGQILNETKLTRVHYLALVLVVTGGLFEVIEQLIISSLGPSLQDAFAVSVQDLAGLSTATLIALAAGGVLGGFLADRVGRRSVLAVSVGIYSFGSLVAAFSGNWEMLIVARVVTGIGVGGEIAVGLTYLSELTPTRIRGLFVSLFNTISAGVGMFIAFAYTIAVLGPVAALVHAGDDAWRWAFGLLAVPAILVFFFRRYLPETPRFLLEKHRVAELNASLTRLSQGKVRLTANDEITEHFTQADVESLSAEKATAGNGRFADLFTGAQRARTINLSLVAFLAWGAQFSILLIMPLLLVERGYTISGSLAFTMVQNLGGLFGAILASIGAYRLPRRTTIAIGSVLAIVTIILFAFFAVSPALIIILGFLFNFSVMTVNTTIWTWSPELFPTKIRGFGTSVVVNVGFIGGALIPLVTAWLYQDVDPIATFIIVAVIYVGILCLSRFVTETHGKSSEELDATA